MVALSFERYVDLLILPVVLFRGQPHRVRRQATLTLQQQAQVEHSLVAPVTPADQYAFVSLQIVDPLPPLARHLLSQQDRWRLRLLRRPLPMNKVELDDLFQQVHAVMLRDLERERKYREKKDPYRERRGSTPDKKAEAFDVGRWLGGLMDRFGGKPDEWERVPRFLIDAAVEGFNAIREEQDVAAGLKPEQPVVLDTPEKFFSAFGLPVPEGVTPRPVEIDPAKIMPMHPMMMPQRQQGEAGSQPQRPPTAPYSPRQRVPTPGTVNRQMREELTGGR